MAGPKVQDAVDNLSPKVDAAHDVIVDSWLPKVSAAVGAVVAASLAAKDQVVDAKDQVVEVSGRAPDAVAVLRGDAVAKPKRGGKLLIGLGIVAAIGAAVAVLANRKPKDDPWATPSTTYTPPARTFGDRVTDVKDKAAAAAGTATQKAGELADKAKDVAGDAADKAKGAGGSAVDKAKDVTGTAADKRRAKDTGSETVDVLGDVAETASETAGDVASDTAGAAHDVKADVKHGADKAADRVDDAT